MLNSGREYSLRVINIIIGVVGTLDNLFVIITFALFIKITDKVPTILHSTTCDLNNRSLYLTTKIILAIRCKDLLLW